MTEEILEFQNSEFLIRYKKDYSGDSWVYTDFIAWEIIMWKSDGTVEFQKKDWVSSEDTTPNPEEAEIFVRGSIKWDDCSNIEFPSGGYHSCSKEEIMAIGELLNYLVNLSG